MTSDHPSKQQVLAMMDSRLDTNLSFNTASAYAGKNLGMRAADNPTVGYASSSVTSLDTSLSCWHYWQDWYYPTVIKESYPVYISERAKDKGKQAFEIVKILKDKKLAKLDKVADFIDLMDELIKIL